MKITIAIECTSIEEARRTLDQLGGSSIVTFTPPTVFGSGAPSTNTGALTDPNWAPPRTGRAGVYAPRRGRKQQPRR